MIHNFSRADELMSAICDFVSSIVGEPAELVHQRFTQEIYGSEDNRTRREFEESEGAAIEQRTAELMAPFVDHRRNAQNYLEKTLRDGWSGCNGRNLKDIFLFALALLSQGHVKQEEVAEEDDDICASCGSDRFVRFDDGSENCFDCIPSEGGPTKEEVQETINELEKQGLVEWTGEWRPARDGTMEKAYRAVDKRQLH